MSTAQIADSAGGVVAPRGVTPGTVTDAPYGSGFVLRDPGGLELELFAPPSG